VLSVDVSEYYRPGDKVTLDIEPESGLVLVTVDTEDERKALALDPRQARALAAALVHCAGEVSR
jgi:hypothetical protein